MAYNNTNWGALGEIPNKLGTWWDNLGFNNIPTYESQYAPVDPGPQPTFDDPATLKIAQEMAARLQQQFVPIAQSAPSTTSTTPIQSQAKPSTGMGPIGMTNQGMSPNNNTFSPTNTTQSSILTPEQRFYQNQGKFNDFVTQGGLEQSGFNQDVFNGLGNDTPVNTAPSTFSQGWNALGGMEGVAQGLNAISGIGQSYIGFQQLGLAEDQFNFTRNSWQQDYDMRLADYNRQVSRQEDRDAALAR